MDTKNDLMKSSDDNIQSSISFPYVTNSHTFTQFEKSLSTVTTCKVTTSIHVVSVDGEAMTKP
jgi:hypothetical protein